MPARFASSRVSSEEVMRDEARLRRLALQLAAQLPEDLAEARAVLSFVSEFLEGFLVPTGAGSSIVSLPELAPID